MDSPWLISRPMTSVGPPGGNGMMSRIGRAGQASCAATENAHPQIPSAASRTTRAAGPNGAGLHSASTWPGRVSTDQRTSHHARIGCSAEGGMPAGSRACRQSKAFRCRRPTRLAAAHVARLGGRDTSIAGARGVEIRPSPRTAINVERPNIGAITLSTQNRRAGADLRRQTRKRDKTRRGNRKHSDGVGGLDRDT